jgi:hypothetical protein
MELQVAVGLSTEEIAMNNKSKLDRLAYKLRLWLPVIFWLAAIAVKVADFVSKTVNYHARQVRKLHALLPA